MKVVVLAGGLGGSRFARALAETIDPGELTIVGNVGDDVEILGLHVSPDLDTILYTLTGRLDEAQGLGPRGRDVERARDAWRSSAARRWFRLGDLDLGAPSRPHRGAAARRAAFGRHRPDRASPSGSSRRCCPRPTSACARWLEPLPPASCRSRSGSSRARHRDEVDGVRFEGAEAARPAPGVLEALEAADLIAIAPSNPFVSIGPILAVAGIREALERRTRPGGRRQPADRRRGGARPGRPDAGAPRAAEPARSK